MKETTGTKFKKDLLECMIEFYQSVYTQRYNTINQNELAIELTQLFLVASNIEQSKFIREQESKMIKDDDLEYSISFLKVPFMSSVFDIVSRYKGIQVALNLFYVVSAVYPPTPNTDDMSNDDFFNCEEKIRILLTDMLN